MGGFIRVCLLVILVIASFLPAKSTFAGRPSAATPEAIAAVAKAEQIAQLHMHASLQRTNFAMREILRDLNAAVNSLESEEKKRVFAEIEIISDNLTKKFAKVCGTSECPLTDAALATSEVLEDHLNLTLNNGAGSPKLRAVRRAFMFAVALGAYGAVVSVTGLSLDIIGPFLNKATSTITSLISATILVSAGAFFLDNIGPRLRAGFYKIVNQNPSGQKLYSVISSRFLIVLGLAKAFGDNVTDGRNRERAAYSASLIGLDELFNRTTAPDSLYSLAGILLKEGMPPAAQAMLNHDRYIKLAQHFAIIRMANPDSVHSNPDLRALENAAHPALLIAEQIRMFVGTQEHFNHIMAHTLMLDPEYRQAKADGKTKQTEAIFKAYTDIALMWLAPEHWTPEVPNQKALNAFAVVRAELETELANLEDARLRRLRDAAIEGLNPCVQAEARVALPGT